MEILHRNRINNAKRAFSTRRMPVDAAKTLLSKDSKPRSGDLVLACVKKLGQHKRIELPTGRRASLFVGDEIVLSYGNRYAPDQFEAYVPEDLGQCHMVAAGGIAAQATCWHGKISGPTEIEPIGLIGCAKGKVLNLADFSIAPASLSMPKHIFAVFGTSMNAGKTITAATLVKGLTRAGHRVGAAKITGTGAGGDLWLMRDSGAVEALDFTDTGLPSTFEIDPTTILDSADRLIGTLGNMGCSVVVVEVADGLYQKETAILARSERFRAMLSGTLFAAGDAMGGVSGAASLADWGHTVLGISGALTQSPLAIREAAATAIAPVYTLDELREVETIAPWVPGAARFARAACE